MLEGVEDPYNVVVEGECGTVIYKVAFGSIS